MTSKIKRVILIIIAALAFVMIVGYLAGYRYYAIETGSMEKKYPVGSLTIVKKMPGDKIKKNNVITFRTGNKAIVTHRAININYEEKSVETKGDANNTPDSSKTNFKNVIGKVVIDIPYAGYIIMYFSTVVGKLTLLLAIIIWVIA